MLSSSLIILCLFLICVKSHLIDVKNSNMADRSGYQTIFWMHIQKTSSWIGNFLMVWACPEYCRHELQSRHKSLPNDTSFYDGIHKHFNIPKSSNNDMVLKSSLMNCSVNFNSYDQGFGWHVPNNDKTMKGAVVTLFRKPTSRVISAYLFGIMLPVGIPDRPKNGMLIQEKVRKSSNPIYTYASYPGISSCQTKMLLGYFCAEPHNITANDIIEAKRRLKEDLYFFGLTEEPVASANLFLAMHHQDGGLPIRKQLDQLIDPPFSFTSTRSNTKHSSESHADLLKSLLSTGWTDEYDDIIYAHASRIFYRRCKEYKIATVFKSIDELMNHLHM